ncbi:hypothetical protein [Aquipuribacter hungaricus]|uniref:hypothetical protein n=1 Tax=Aquipuribacter hungaricus TaxID=545624 RepID=UPI0030EE209C
MPPGPLLGRAEAWSVLARALLSGGRRDRALVAARTALALLDRADAGDDLLDAARALVEASTGPDVVPLHVDMAGGGGGPDPGSGEARAVWLGAGDPVLAMMGWVERDGALEVVRVVAPGTRRGRRAFAALVAALPEQVPVEVVLPARDPALLRACRRAGFEAVEGSVSARGHVGGSLRVRRGGGAT